MAEPLSATNVAAMDQAMADARKCFGSTFAIEDPGEWAEAFVDADLQARPRPVSEEDRLAWVRAWSMGRAHARAFVSLAHDNPSIATDEAFMTRWFGNMVLREQDKPATPGEETLYG